MKISTQNLEKALGNLRLFLSLYEVQPVSEVNMRNALKASCIQAFEYSYESAIKTIRRLFKNFENDFDVRDINFKDFIRIAFERGVISNTEIWYDFRDNRNITSHTYHEKSADDVFSIIPKFIKEVEFLIAQANKSR